MEVHRVLKTALEGELTTRDASPSGVFLETTHLLDVGDPVILTFPIEGGPRMVVHGRVRWVTPFGRMDDPTPGMGIEFVGLDPARRVRLRDLLAARRG